MSKYVLISLSLLVALFVWWLWPNPNAWREWSKERGWPRSLSDMDSRFDDWAHALENGDPEAIQMALAQCPTMDTIIAETIVDGFTANFDRSPEDALRAFSSCNLQLSCLYLRKNEKRKARLLELQARPDARLSDEVARCLDETR